MKWWLSFSFKAIADQYMRGKERQCSVIAGNLESGEKNLSRIWKDGPGEWSIVVNVVKVSRLDALMYNLRVSLGIKPLTCCEQAVTPGLFSIWEHKFFWMQEFLKCKRWSEMGSISERRNDETAGRKAAIPFLTVQPRLYAAHIFTHLLTPTRNCSKKKKKKDI